MGSHELGLVHDQVRTTFGQNFHRARIKRGFEIKHLADLAGISHQTVRDIEAGKRWPQLDSLLMLMASLDVEFDELLPEDWQQEFANRGLRLLQGKVQALAEQLNSRSSEGSNRVIYGVREPKPDNWDYLDDDPQTFNQQVKGSSPFPGARQLRKVA